jgi:hypothetical protein
MKKEVGSVGQIAFEPSTQCENQSGRQYKGLIVLPFIIRTEALISSAVSGLR